MPKLDEGDWQRVADYIRAELARRRWTQRDLAARAGTSTRAVSDLLSGRPVRRMPPSAGRVEHALGWPPGAVRRLLTGGEIETETARPVFDSPEEQAIWELSSLPEQTRRGLIAYLRAHRNVDEVG